MLLLTLIFLFLTIVTLVLGLSLQPEGGSVRTRVATWAAAAASPPSISAIEENTNGMVKTILSQKRRVMLRAPRS